MVRDIPAAFLAYCLHEIHGEWVVDVNAEVSCGLPSARMLGAWAALGAIRGVNVKSRP
jgi:hypothetical protein